MPRPLASLLALPLRWQIAVILAIGAAARLWRFPLDGVHHADEAIQYLEQAHRLVFGQGLVPWEYRAGMRSWLMPLLLAGPMWLGQWFGAGALYPIGAARIVVALAALAPLWAAYALGARLSRGHALVALAVMAWWYESVFFSVHVLTETLATACLLPAAALLYGRRSPRRMVLAGLLLTLGVIIRFQYGPAVAVLALFGLGRDWPSWRRAAAGGLAAVALSVTVDLGMGQPPFGWIVQNVFQNVVQDRASAFGRMGPFGYARMMLEQWQALALVLPVLAWIGAKRYPLLLAVAITNIAVHIFVGHKEYRFIWLSIALSLVLAAIGSVDLADALRRRWHPEWPRRAVLAAVAGLWGVASAVLAATPTPDRLTRTSFADVFAFSRKLAAERACGLAIHGDPYWISGGQAWLHPGRTKLYFLPQLPEPGDSAGLRALAPVVDAIVSAGPPRSMPKAFRQLGCSEDADVRYCFYRRSGVCRPGHAAARWEAQRVIERYGL